jgi:hypothetical protein
MNLSTQCLLNDLAFQKLLFRYDTDIANSVHGQKCPIDGCNGHLDFANYMRHPKGAKIAKEELPPDLWLRYSFCCSNRNARIRVTPPSLRFLGPKVHLAVLVVLIAAMRCGPTPTRMRVLQDEVGVDERTVRRWKRWWEEVVPTSNAWKAEAATFDCGADLKEMPLSILEAFSGSLGEKVGRLLRLLKLLTVGRLGRLPRKLDLPAFELPA